MASSIGIHPPFASASNGFYATALHSTAQGSRLRRVPWVHHAIRDPNPNGVLQTRDDRVTKPSSITNRHERPRRTRSITTAFMASSIGIHQPFASASNGFYANGVTFHSPGFAASPRTLGNHADAIQTPTGFYKPAMPRHQTIIHYKRGHER